jgi:hypothetical protein
VPTQSGTLSLNEHKETSLASPWRWMIFLVHLSLAGAEVGIKACTTVGLGFGRVCQDKKKKCRFG